MSTAICKFRIAALLFLIVSSQVAWAGCPQDRSDYQADFSHADFVFGRANDKFGSAVATNGDVIAVGRVRRDFQVDPDPGTVYLFQRNAASGQWSFLRELSEPGFSAHGDSFGGAVAMQSETLVVGAIQAGDDANNNAGAVYIFGRNQGGAHAWGVRQTIYVQEEDGFQSFGESIAIDGNRMLVGDSDAGSTHIGRVIVYERSGAAGDFHAAAELLAPVADLGGTRDFARHVALDGDIAVVSDPLFDSDELSGLEGRVYLFKRNAGNGQWSLLKRLSAPLGIKGFGNAVSLSDDRIAVSNGQAQPGHVFLFERNAGGTDNWGQVADLTAGVDSQTNDEFGVALDLHSRELMVGVANGSGTTGSTGAVYVFRRDEGGPNHWGQAQKLFSQTNNSRSTYGATLDWAAGTAVIGDPLSDHPSFDPSARVGRAYAYYNDVIFCDSFE